MVRHMRIGEAARTAGVSPDTLRYYERLGLLPPPVRTGNGYRVYSEAAVRRVRVIRNGLAFGFSLRELRSFFTAREANRPPCREVRAAAERLLDDVEQQIEALVAARARMRHTLRDWDTRLDSAGDGAPAHLLAALPPLQAAIGRQHTGRRRPGGRGAGRSSRR